MYFKHFLAAASVEEPGSDHDVAMANIWLAKFDKSSASRLENGPDQRYKSFVVVGNHPFDDFLFYSRVSRFKGVLKSLFYILLQIYKWYSTDILLSLIVYQIMLQ